MAFPFLRKRSDQSARTGRQLQTRQRRCVLEPLEHRQLLAVLFANSFEHGGSSNDWDGNWVEDGQNDWFRSSQRASDGSKSAEVDGFFPGGFHQLGSR